MKFRKWRWPIFFSMAVVALTGYWLTQFWLGPQMAALVVTKEEMVQTITTVGKVELPAPVNITSKIGGKIVALKVSNKQSVKTGDTLLRLESRNDRIALDKAKAASAQAEARFRKISEQTQAGSKQSLHQAKVTLNNAKKKYDRTNELSAKGFISREQANEAVRNLAIAHSQLATAQFQAKANRAKGSEYAIAELALNKARAKERSVRESAANRVLKAEHDGILLMQDVKLGTNVIPGKTLMQIVPQGKAKLTALLEQGNINDLKAGQQAYVLINEHPEQRFIAEIRQIELQDGQPSSRHQIILETTQAPNSLTQTTPVTIEIEVTHHHGVLSLSTNAIHNLAGKEPWVMLVENGRAKRRAIKLGISGKTTVEVIEGLKEGDLVLPASETAIEEGKRMRLAKAG